MKEYDEINPNIINKQLPIVSNAKLSPHPPACTLFANITPIHSSSSHNIESTPVINQDYSSSNNNTNIDEIKPTLSISDNSDLLYYSSEFAISHPLSVLVAEDNIINQKLINKMLIRLGYKETKMVENGKIAADKSIQRIIQIRKYFMLF